MSEPPDRTCEKGHYRKRRRPSFPWHETPHLTLDECGRLWLRPDPDDDQAEDLDPEDLGPIESDPAVPAGCEAELAELLDLWRDAGSLEDLRREWRGDYFARLR